MIVGPGAKRPRFKDGRLPRLLISVLALLLFLPVGEAQAGQWGGAVVQIQASLNKVVDLYQKGDVEAAKEAANLAYFEVYESSGMEAAVRLNISAKQAATEEYYFSRLKSLVIKGAPAAEVVETRDTLVAMLKSDAAALEGDGGGAVSDVLSSFMIIAREGVEAILLIAALTAYLVKSGHGDQVKIVYNGSVVAILLSLVTAWFLNSVLKVSGTATEALEGFTMLAASLVLLSVSFWMISKAQADAWQGYLKEQLGVSLSRGNRLSLWWAAFLAVYREGAETVLFYQALASSGASFQWLAVGFGIGVLALVIIFLAVRWGSWKIPLRPFFRVTSILLFYMAIAFTGTGILELQAADLVPVTPLAGVPTVDWAGIYPTAETLGVQAVLLLLALGTGFILFKRRAPQRV